MILLTQDPLNPRSITSEVTRDRNGAIITFLGNTRRLNGDKEVLFLEYEVYEPMALKELEKIKRAAIDKWGDVDIAIAHRFGRLEIEDTSLVVAIGSQHRREGFDVCNFIVNRIKETVPIWKKEVFADGSIWVGCQSHKHSLSALHPQN
jgi:molybdopterin synthase catalytic subunit